MSSNRFVHDPISTHLIKGQYPSRANGWVHKGHACALASIPSGHIWGLNSRAQVTGP